MVTCKSGIFLKQINVVSCLFKSTCVLKPTHSFRKKTRAEREWPSVRERRFPASDIALSHLIRMIDDHGWSGDNMADRRQLFVEMSEYLEAEP